MTKALYRDTRLVWIQLKSVILTALRFMAQFIVRYEKVLIPFRSVHIIWIY
jgi:hypothetical protein